MSRLTRFWLDRLRLTRLSPRIAKLRWAHHCTSPHLRLRGHKYQPRRLKLPAHIPCMGLPRRRHRHPPPHCEPLPHNLLLLLRPVHPPRLR
jgi:hypothetical protein